MKVATIDFWNTLFNSAGGAPRNDARKAALLAALDASGDACDREKFEEVYGSIWEYFDHHWLERQRTLSSREMIEEICRRLDRTLGEPTIEQVADIFSRGVLDHPPEMFPGVPEGLELLRSRGIRLALISDTAFSPGSVLRELMERNGIAGYFDTYVFSDETGVAKPHPDAFMLALAPSGVKAHEAFHIGDIERTDIRGAKGVGMKAVIYRGDDASHKYAEEDTIADAVMHHWNEIETVLDRLHESVAGDR